MMNTPEPEDWLDAKLRDEAPYLDDAGFTKSVVHKLPARGASKHFRATLLVLLTILGSVAAYVLSGGSRLGFEVIARLGLFPPIYLWLALFATAALASVVAAAAAINKARQ